VKTILTDMNSIHQRDIKRWNFSGVFDRISSAGGFDELPPTRYLLQAIP